MAILLSILLTGVQAQDVRTDQRAIDQEHTDWIEHVLRVVSHIKPGMTRQSLSRSFEGDVGLQSRSQGRYAYKHCHNIKIDIEFSRVDDGPDFSPDDKIVKVSRPYLEYPISD
ncbi:MAG: hypothetical protein ACXWC0_30985 [Burkholderiales bacterium]